MKHTLGFPDPQRLEDKSRLAASVKLLQTDLECNCLAQIGATI